MKKAIALLAVVIVFCGVLTGCSSEYKSGSYRAEFADFDEHGWKEYVDVVIDDGAVTELTFGAIDTNGNDKSEDADCREIMEMLDGTYPQKFYSDIVNQYLESGKLDSVATVAGATISTDNFRILMEALEENFSTGDTETHVVEKAVSSKSK